MYYELTTPSNESKKGYLRAGEGGKIVTKPELQKVQRNRLDSVYHQSLFCYANDFKEYVSDNKSVREYLGKKTMDHIVFDFDSDNDLEFAHKAAKNFVLEVQRRYNYKTKDWRYFFSGSKGFHLYLPMGAIEPALPPSTTLHEKIKAFVTQLICDLYDITPKQLQKPAPTEYYSTFDTGIYKPTALIRLPNSINPKSGLYKTEIAKDNFFAMTIEQIKELAKSKEAPKIKSIDVFYNERMNQVWQDSQKVGQNKIDSIDRESYDGHFFDVPTKGNRNETYFKQACLILSKSELHESAVEALLWPSVQLSNDGLTRKDWFTQQELKAVVKSAKKTVDNNTEQNKKTSRLSRMKSQQNTGIETFSDIRNSWIDYELSDQKSDLTLGFDTIDDDVKNYRGTFCMLCGKGGTKKSMLARSIAVQNIQKNHAVVAYSMFEENAIRVAPHFIDMTFAIPENADDYKKMQSFGSIHDYYLSFFRDAKERGELQQFKELVEKQGELIDTNLIFNRRSGMDAEAHALWLDDIIEMHGRVDILVIDGMAGLGNGKGEREHEALGRHTKEFQKLAQAYNILVIGLYHLTKEGNVYDRNPFASFRGSGKVLDEIDFGIGLGKLIDDRNTFDTTNIVCHEDVGFVHYFGKRMKIQSHLEVFEFHADTKTIWQCFGQRKIEDYLAYEELVKQLSDTF